MTIEIQPLKAEHRQDASNLIMASFFTQEPLNSQLHFEIPHEPLPWVDDMLDTAYRNDCSFVAIDTSTPNKTVVGVILNSISKQDDKEESHDFPSEKLSFIFSIIDRVTRGTDLYQLYQTDRIYHCDILNIDESQRGKNLSARLVEESLNKVRQLGVKGAAVVCTSLFSRKAFQRQGFQVINEVFYSDYERLTDMGVHDRCTLLGKQL